MMNEFLESILSRLQEIFNPKDLGNQLAQGLVNVLVGLAVFLAFFLLWRIVMAIMRRTVRSTRLDETSYSFAETSVKYAILTIGLVSALDAVGINTGAILASLGVVGVTIGFAARDSLSNLISGIIIFLDRPFVIGDLVEIERVRELLLDLVDQDPEYLLEPAPRVVLTQLNDYNLTLELQAWLKNERDHVEKRFNLRERAFNALNNAGVEMPFETIQLAPMRVDLAS
jgi:small-conductance mechanosensitive channel